MSIENPNTQDQISDPTKAEEMATESDERRSRAVEMRKKINETRQPYTDELKEGFARAAEVLDRQAERLERATAIDHDVEELAREMSIEELVTATKESFADKKSSHEEMISLRIAAADAPSEEDGKRLSEKAKEAENVAEQLSRRSFAFDLILATQQTKE